MTDKEKPKYRLTGKAYINDTLYDPDSAKDPIVIEFDGRPSKVMEPVNEAARLMTEQFPPNRYDPIRAMTEVSKTEQAPRAQIEAEARAKIQAEEREKAEAELRATIEAEVRAKMEAEAAEKVKDAPDPKADGGNRNQQGGQQGGNSSNKKR